MTQNVFSSYVLMVVLSISNITFIDCISLSLQMYVFFTVAAVVVSVNRISECVLILFGFFLTRRDNFSFFVALDVYYTFFYRLNNYISKCIHWFLCGFPFFLISVILCCHALLSLDSLVYEFGSISTQIKFTTQTEIEGDFCK